MTDFVAKNFVTIDLKVENSHFFKRTKLSKTPDRQKNKTVKPFYF